MEVIINKKYIILQFKKSHPCFYNFEEFQNYCNENNFEITSDEPGCYIHNKYMIMIEDLVKKYHLKDYNLDPNKCYELRIDDWNIVIYYDENNSKVFRFDYKNNELKELKLFKDPSLRVRINKNKYVVNTLVKMAINKGE